MNSILFFGFLLCFIPTIMSFAIWMEDDGKLALKTFIIPPALYIFIVWALFIKVEETTIDRKVMLTEEMVPIVSKIDRTVINLGEKYTRSFKEGDIVKEKVKTYQMKIFGTFKESRICLP